MKKRNVTWVVAGGPPGEIGHCLHCGDGLKISLPQSFPVIAAAAKAFAKEHARCTTKIWTEPVPTTPQQWAAGRDTGISSMTIYSVVMGVPIDRADVPHDPDDFGRCYRLLQLFPAWKKRLFRLPSVIPSGLR